MADIQPLLTDELLIEPTTGRITIRAQDFFEALRVAVNQAGTTSVEQVEQLQAAVGLLSSKIAELEKRLSNVEQQANDS